MGSTELVMDSQIVDSLFYKLGNRLLVCPPASVFRWFRNFVSVARNRYLTSLKISSTNNARPGECRTKLQTILSIISDGNLVLAFLLTIPITEWETGVVIDVSAAAQSVRQPLR
jgi:hypothetical protein